MTNFKYSAPYELRKSRPGDSGYDLFCDPSVPQKQPLYSSYFEPDNKWIMIYPGTIVPIRTGVRIQIPAGWGAFICERSGFPSRGTTLIVHGGVIDSNYRGEIVVFLGSTSYDTIRINAEKAIAQLVIQPVYDEVLVRVAPQDLDQTVRGESGFGSSDK